MEVSSVGSSAATPQQQLSSDKAAQQSYADQADEQARMRQEAARTDVTQSNPQAPGSDAVQRRERNEEARQTQQSKVFVNAQGQKTGTIINVAA